MGFDLNIPDAEIGIDAQGKLWVSEVDGPYFGQFDPDTFTYTRHEIPAGSYERMFGQIAIDPENYVWILDNGSSPYSELHRYNPETKQVASYFVPAPLRYRSTINSLRFLDGNVWGTGNASSRVIKLDPRTGEVTDYPTQRGAHPFGIDIGADKAVSYITNYNHQIVRLDPATGEETTFSPPTPRSGLERMGADALGNLWAAGHFSNALVKLDPRTGEVTEYPIPTINSEPYSVDVDKSQNLIWFSEIGAYQLGRFDPSTETFIEFPLPVAGNEALRLLVDPVNPNRVWWNCSTGCSIGYIEVLN
jgi:virginiamycin B lyase